MEIDYLMLISGNDIPFIKGGFVIHQPTLKEIGLIGEENFYTGCELLKFSKDLLNDEDKNNLIDKTDFDILMIILQEKNNISIRSRVCLEMVLTLIFPNYTFKIEQQNILLYNKEEKFFINNENFEEFKKYIEEIFCLNQGNQDNFNPSGDLAKKIAEKLKSRHKKLAQSNQENKGGYLERLISILSVGLSISLHELFNYTIYQLLDTYRRYDMKINYDMFIEAKLAGAKDLKEVDNWMKNIHSTKEEK